MTRPSPCRLFVYLARDAPLAVVLRRGPSDWVRLSLWHTDTDAFEHGQWMSGRVFERRSDISPDGRLFAYFVRKDTARARSEIGADSWVAISRPPWFTALALWAVGGTYWLGSQFIDSDTLFIGGATDAPDQGALPSWLSLAKLPGHLDQTPDRTDRSVYFARLLRDGWSPIPEAQASLPWWGRRSPDGARTLIMMARSYLDFQAYGGRHITEYGVRDEATGDLHDIGRATWADWDHAGRLIVAQDGRLLHWRAPADVTVLADFNDQKPHAEPSPPHAGQWPALP